MAEIQKALEAYDSRRFGPLLGVSDEGSAAETIVNAAYSSAKAQVRGPGADAMCVGVIVDGERMTSAGEVPIGPDEYSQILRATQGRTFCTTNVGVRVNVRLDQPLPEFRVADAKIDERKWLAELFELFGRFLHTPDGQPRPLTVRLLVESEECFTTLREIVPKIEDGRQQNRLGAPSLHRLSCLMIFADEISTEAHIDKIRHATKVASSLKMPEVAIDGKLREAARRRLSVQGLLNVLEPATARALIKEAGEVGVCLTYRYSVDEDSAARTVWTGLNSARQEGLTAAKYGLVPLTFSEQKYVVAQNQGWMNDWTPIPAFYVDTPLVAQDDVYESDRCVEAATMWLDLVAQLGAKVILVDCPDRISPRRLLQTDGGPTDRGVLSLDQVRTLSQHADALGLKVLWSGGITAQQAFDLAGMRVGGVFTTSSTAQRVAVHGPLVDDPQLAAAVEPTELGVRRIHALLQAGFLCSVIRERNRSLTESIENQATALIQAGATGEGAQTALTALDKSLVQGWSEYWA